MLVANAHPAGIGPAAAGGAGGTGTGGDGEVGGVTGGATGEATGGATGEATGGAGGKATGGAGGGAYTCETAATAVKIAIISPQGKWPLADILLLCNLATVIRHL